MEPIEMPEEVVPPVEAKGRLSTAARSGVMPKVV